MSYETNVSDLKGKGVGGSWEAAKTLFPEKVANPLCLSGPAISSPVQAFHILAFSMPSLVAIFVPSSLNFKLPMIDLCASGSVIATPSNESQILTVLFEYIIAILSPDGLKYP